MNLDDVRDLADFLFFFPVDPGGSFSLHLDPDCPIVEALMSIDDDIANALGRAFGVRVDLTFNRDTITCPSWDGRVYHSPGRTLVAVDVVEFNGWGRL